jgi:hypothetical protein
MWSEITLQEMRPCVLEENRLPNIILKSTLMNKRGPIVIIEDDSDDREILFDILTHSTTTIRLFLVRMVYKPCNRRTEACD